MAGSTVRTTTIYKALRILARKANNCDRRAQIWREQYGPDDEMRRFELVRAEAYREAIQHLVEHLELDASQLWPDLVNQN